MRKDGQPYGQAVVAEGLVEVAVDERLVDELDAELLDVTGVLVLIAVVHGTRTQHPTDTGPHQHA